MASKYGAIARALKRPPPAETTQTLRGADLIEKDPRAAIVNLSARDPSGAVDFGQGLSRAEYTFTPKGDLQPWKEFDPAQAVRERGVIAGLLGDRSAAGSIVHDIGGVKLTEPVNRMGGGEFMRSLEGPEVWASRPSAVGGIYTRIGKNLKKMGAPEDTPVFVTNVVSGLPSIDSTQMMAKAILRQIEPTRGQIDPEVAKLFDAAVRKKYPKWPGILEPVAAENFLAQEEVGKRTSKILQLLDKQRAQAGGLPNLGTARFAMMEPRLVSAPQGSTGFAVSRLDPDRVINAAAHDTYPTGMLGPSQSAADYMGGTRYQVPLSVMFPDWWKTVKPTYFDKKMNLTRPTTPTMIQQSVLTRVPAQRATQEWLDNLMRYTEQNPQKWGYRAGGKVGNYDRGGFVRRAMQLAREYKDPKTTKIEDWKWRDLPAVQRDLNITEIPPHVQAFGDYMREISEKAAKEGLSADDLIRAYTTTRASIQRQAIDADKVRATGLPVVGDDKVRPEGAWAEWLMTPAGRQFVGEAAKGNLAAAAVASAKRVMAPFGKHETDIPDAMKWAAENLPGREGVATGLVARGAQMTSKPSEWRDFVRDMRGIGPSKSGFVASLLGRGDLPTLDARQLMLHTGEPTKAASAFIRRGGGLGGQEAVDRLAARQAEMALKVPEKYNPFYQHLAHHSVWDRAGGDVTTHSDVMRAMRSGFDQGGAPVRDEDVYGPANIEERRARVQALSEAAQKQYPGDAIEAPYGYITPAAATGVKTTELGPVPVGAGGEELSWIRQPAVLPLYRDPTAGVRSAMPGFLDVAGSYQAAPAGVAAVNLARTVMAGQRPAANVASAMGAQAPAYERALTPMGLYSRGEETAATLSQAKGTPEQYAAMLQRAGVRPAEMEGFAEAFAGRPSVTREDVAKYFRERMPQVEETVLGGKETPPIPEDRYRELARAWETRQLTPEEMRDFNAYERYVGGERAPGSEYRPPKFEKYTIPGGENYREVLLRTPGVSLDALTAAHSKADKLNKQMAQRLGKWKTLAEGRSPGVPETVAAYRQYAAVRKERDEALAEFSRLSRERAENTYKSPHWPGEPNVLAHLRMSDRTGPQGEKVLHLEELQSDWGQAGRKEGFRTGRPQYYVQNTASGNRSRAFDSFDEANAYRQQLPERTREQTSVLTDTASSTEGMMRGPYVTSTEGWTDLALKRALREAAEGGHDRLVWTPGAEQAKRYGLDLQTGGEGMKAYYDKIVPKRLHDLARRHDKSAKVEMMEGFLPDNIVAPGIVITPAMRESVLKGQPHMRAGGRVSRETGGPVLQGGDGLSQRAADLVRETNALARHADIDVRRLATLFRLASTNSMTQQQATKVAADVLNGDIDAWARRFVEFPRSTRIISRVNTALGGNAYKLFGRAANSSGNMEPNVSAVGDAPAPTYANGGGVDREQPVARGGSGMYAEFLKYAKQNYPADQVARFEKMAQGEPLKLMYAINQATKNGLISGDPAAQQKYQQELVALNTIARSFNVSPRRAFKNHPADSRAKKEIDQLIDVTQSDPALGFHDALVNLRNLVGGTVVR